MFGTIFLVLALVGTWAEGTSSTENRSPTLVNEPQRCYRITVVGMDVKVDPISPLPTRIQPEDLYPNLQISPSSLIPSNELKTTPISTNSFYQRTSSTINTRSSLDVATDATHTASLSFSSHSLSPTVTPTMFSERTASTPGVESQRIALGRPSSSQSTSVTSSPPANVHLQANGTYSTSSPTGRINPSSRVSDSASIPANRGNSRSNASHSSAQEVGTRKARSLDFLDRVQRLKKRGIDESEKPTFRLRDVAGCEEPCMCTWCGGDLIHTCTHKNLKHIPDEIPRIATEADFSNNALAELPVCGFYVARDLEVLSARNNLIPHIFEHTFYGLSKLIILRLDGNRLTDDKVDIKAFSDIPHIAFLYFSRNRLSEVSKARFGQLTKLRSLYLDHNQISTIEDGAFVNNPLLKSLNLNNNLLTNITSAMVRELTNLHSLYLSSNEIEFVDTKALEELPALRVLVLHGNKISKLGNLLFSDDNGKLTKFFWWMVSGLSENNSRPVEHLHLQENAPQSHAQPAFIVTLTGRLKDVQSFHEFQADNWQKSGFQCNRRHGTATCTPCRPGYYLADDFTPYCKQCPAGGFYQDQYGSQGPRYTSGCRECPRGSYVEPKDAPATSVSYCKLCPKGTNTSMVAGHRACPCLENHHRTDRFGPCKPCPVGLICADDSMRLAPGYFWSGDFHGADKIEYFKFVKSLITEDDTYNTSISSYTGKIPEAVRCPIKGACLGGIDARCSTGYRGPLCSACDNGFYSRQGVCIECASKSFSIILLLTVALILAVVIYFMMKTNKEDSESGSSVMARFKIYIGFYQMLSAIFEQISFLQLAPSLLVVAGFVDFLQINLASLVTQPCLYSSYMIRVGSFGQMLFALCLNLFVVVMAALYFFIRSPVVKSKENDIKADSLRQRCTKITFVLIYTFYPTTCQKILQVFPNGCEKVCSTSGQCWQFLKIDPEVPCYGYTHIVSLVLACLGIAYVVGVPVVLAYLIWKRTQPHKVWVENQPTESPKNTAYDQGLFFIRQDYSFKGRFWEVAEMVERTLVIAGLSVLGFRERGLIAMITMVLFCFFVAEVLLDVRLKNDEKYLKIVCRTCLLLVMMFIHTRYLRVDNGLTTTVKVAAFFIIIISLVPFGHVTVQLFQGKGRAMVDSVLRPIIALKLWVNKCLGLAEKQVQVNNNLKAVVAIPAMERNNKSEKQKKNTENVIYDR